MSWPVARKITITLEVSDEATPIQVAAMKALVLTADEGKGVTALGKLINKSRTRAHAYLNGSTVPGPVAVEISRALDGSPTVEELITGKFADQEDETE
jgi:hypothetical protein